MEWKHEWGLKYTSHTHTLYDDTKAKEEEHGETQSGNGSATQGSDDGEEETTKGPFDGLKAQTGAAGFHTLRDPARVAKVTDYC